MDEIRSTGKTVDDALTEALIQLGTTSDQVEYDVIEKGSSGFLGIGSKPAVIVVRRKKEEAPAKSIEESVSVKEEAKEAAKAVKKEAKETAKSVKKEMKETAKAVKKESEEVKEAPAQKSSETVAQKPEKQVIPMNGEEVKKKADTFLKEVFNTMNMNVEIKYQTDDANRMISIDLEGDEMGILIGKRGQTLDSLQYLTSLVVNKDTNDYIRVKLDTENYRKRRRATLENLAKNIAYKVKRERKPVTLEPMNPYERRIIHSALQNDRYVETHSEGTEPYRRVVVSLKKNQ